MLKLRAKQQSGLSYACDAVQPMQMARLTQLDSIQVLLSFGSDADSLKLIQSLPDSFPRSPLFFYDCGASLVQQTLRDSGFHFAQKRILQKQPRRERRNIL